MFKNRYDVAKKLVPHLEKYKGDKDAIILAIPRGALELGAYLRDKLNLPLDVVITKKIGAPGNEEYAIGAVAPDGTMSLNKEVVKRLGISQHYIDDEVKTLEEVIRHRYKDYRNDPNPPDFKGKTCIIVDDGVATGFTTTVAIKYLRKQNVKAIVLAIGVSAFDSAAKLKKEVDEFICLEMPADFFAVGQFYQNFAQVGDEEAKKLLHRNA